MTSGKITITKEMWTILIVCALPNLVLHFALWSIAFRTWSGDFDFKLLAAAFVFSPVSAFIAFGTFCGARTNAERILDCFAFVFALLPIGYFLLSIFS